MIMPEEVGLYDRLYSFTVELDGKKYDASLNWDKYGLAICFEIDGQDVFALISEEDYTKIEKAWDAVPLNPTRGFEDLLEKLPPLPKLKKTAENEKKFKELIKKTKAIKFYDGVNYAQLRRKVGSWKKQGNTVNTTCK